MNIIADLHTHTISSGHAYSTLSENISTAQEKGLQFLGISDHAPAMEDAPQENYFKNLKVIKNDWGSLTVLRGTELNILNRYGEVDLSEDILNELDYTVASLHYPFFPKDKISLCTEAAVAAMANPHIFILGHPDEDIMQLDYEAVVLAARHHHVALEVNNSSLCPTSSRKGAAENYRKMLKLARKLEVPVIVSSDSHISYDIGNFSRALTLLHEYEFPEELVINSSLKRFACFWEYRKKASLSANKKNLRCTG